MFIFKNRRNIFLLTTLFWTAGCVPHASYYSGQEQRDIRYYYQAERLYNLSKYAKAVTAYKRYLNHYPQTPLTQPALYYLGKSYQEILKYDQALEIYRQLMDKYQSGFWVDRAREAYIDLENLNSKLK